MSTLDDVQNAMVQILGPAIYPDGYSNPSVINADVSIFAGDPTKYDLDGILAQGKAVVCVFAMKGMTRNTTRVRRLYGDYVIAPATLTLTTTFDTVTVGGTVTAGEACNVIVNGIDYAYKVLTGDTVNSIAASLAGLIPDAVAVANVITISNVYSLVARVSTEGTARRILHSRESLMRVRMYVPNDADRETLGNTIELAFATLEPPYYLQMPDLVSASIRPANAGISEINTYELSTAYMRDYIFLVEYHTVQVNTYQTIADITIDETVSTLPLS